MPTRAAILAQVKQNALGVTLDLNNAEGELLPLTTMADSARVLGVGGTARTAHEFSVQQLRIVSHLVRHCGYRSVILEEDWTLCLELNTELKNDLTAEQTPASGDRLRMLLAEARPFWNTQETLSLLSWIREWNFSNQRDPVCLVGLNSDGTRRIAYDAVASAVRDQLMGADRSKFAHLVDSLSPGDDLQGHRRRLISLDRSELRARLKEAHLLYSVVVGRNNTTEESEFLRRHALAIVDFYEYHSRTRREILRYAASRMSDNLLSWLRFSGHKAIYLGGIAHTSAAPSVALSYPGIAQPNAGGIVRRELGKEYRSVGLTFDHGQLHQRIPHASPTFLEALFAEVEYASFLLDLSNKSDVRNLDHLPLKLRTIGPTYNAANDSEFFLTVDRCLSDGFDLLLHTQRVAQARSLSPEDDRRW